MRQARVIAAHRVPDHPPIRVGVGERVRLGGRDGDWPAFVWITRADGLGGWIPRDLLAAEPDGRHAIAQDTYDTLELAADAGETLRLYREQAGWWWAENRHGARGWFPARHLESKKGHSE
ncbi:peptide-binding protein [Lysobacter pythonis]|uniref:Peptide-binding protein n=1 Tax=Solilutibacter pythonis TaxID=2483112 RepID=A0A3M2I2G0_9GAMM|nr:SH3 domain-containing protein [Lysobacter pythonis]RMH93382.1 peptide-binding protein [Lysobacter pythonis]